MSFVPFSEELIARFWSKVEKKSDDECWRWTGNFTRDGYGQVCQHFHGWGKNRKRKMWGAHRFSFILANGFVPHFCCHSCDNKWCVNPKHLWNGDVRSNAEDMIRKGRSTWGDKNPRAKYSNEIIRMCKILINRGWKAVDVHRGMGIGYSTAVELCRDTRWQRVEI